MKNGEEKHIRTTDHFCFPVGSAQSGEGGCGGARFSVSGLAAD